MPKVSVILTSYNHGAYVAAAIESVLNQTFTDFELLIVDDGSTDNSRKIIKSFDDPRIKNFLYEENRGSVIAIGDAVNSARGKYIAVHHSDDLWALDKLEKQIEFLDANPNYAACFTRVDFVDEQGNLQVLDADDAYKNIFDQPNRSRAEWLNYFFYNANCLCHPSVVLRREVAKKYRLHETHGFWQLPDYLMWIRLCFREEIFILPERLTKFRLRRARQENTSATSYDKLVRADLEFYFIAQEFAAGFEDDKFFLEVFPSAEKFLVDGQINRRFAFAEICLDKKIPSFQLVGLELLKNLLNNPEDAAQIKNLYGYDEKTFLRDGGSFDVFNLTQKLSMLHAEIFIGDGKTFEKAAEKIISVDTSRKFYARVDFDISRKMKSLRFDPDTNFISVKINRTLINGKPQKISLSNAGEIVGGFFRFWTIDPQIIFEVNLSKHVTFEIFGEVEENYSAILEQTIKKLLEEKISQPQTPAESNAPPKKNPLKNFMGRLRVGGKEKFLSAARFLYKALPLGEEKKLALKDKFYTRLAPMLWNTQRYKNWQMSKLMELNKPEDSQNFIYSNVFEGELFSQPGKIAIQAHIFYFDLLDEMAGYCANMPYKFDALISIVDKKIKNKVRAAFENIPNVEKCVVRVVPNRGRDVAPFLVGFGDLLPEYDFVAHIHSKKSLYSGREQQQWRNYLFDALLGSPERVRKIFKAFDDDKTVGVIYPRPADNVPYPSFTWMSNRAVGQNLLNRAGIAPNKADYFDFPAGTMFWARTKVLRKFFTLGLTIEDFPPEQGQNDGTIAHAFERSVLLAAHSEGLNYYEFSPLTEAYSINCGSKNLWQYFLTRNGTEFEFDWLLAQGEIISFAVFDTLLMRCVAAPYHVREIMRLKIADMLGRDLDFPTFRLQAEKISQNPTLDEIYKNFAELTGLDYETCKRIREMEVATEIKLSLPREDVVAWFKEIVHRGREVWIISDTYFQTPDFERLLAKNGISGYKKLLLSCETGRRKDTAAIWNYLAGQGYGGKIIHVGNNETGDAQLPADRNFGIYHLMSAINLFAQIPFGRFLLDKLGGNMSLCAGIFLGVVLAKKFQSPFRLQIALTFGTNRLILSSFREFGYWFYGVPLLAFILRLIQTEQKIFFAKHCRFLRELYLSVAESLNVAPLEGDDCTIDLNYINNFFGHGSFDIQDFDEIQEGVKEFCRDVTEIFGGILLRVPIDEDFVEAWLDSFMSDEKIVTPELREIFELKNA